MHLGAFVGGWEILLLVTVLLILFGVKKWPDLWNGLGRGIREFRDATDQVADELQKASGQPRDPDAPKFSSTLLPGCADS